MSILTDNPSTSLIDEDISLSQFYSIEGSGIHYLECDSRVIGKSTGGEDEKMQIDESLLESIHPGNIVVSEKKEQVKGRFGHYARSIEAH